MLQTHEVLVAILQCPFNKDKSPLSVASQLAAA